MSEARVTNPFVEQFRRGGVPTELRLMAAQGVLPLKPEDLLELLADLVKDPEAAVAEAAKAALTAFPAAEFLPIRKSRETPPPVLAWAVTFRPERELREATLQNTSLADEVIETLARSLSTELAELVVINQVRLLRRTSLHEALVTYLSDEEREEAEKVSTVQKIYRMNTAEKVIAALKGNRQERAVLVRDPNRLVAAAVLGSPRLTERKG